MHCIIVEDQPPAQRILKKYIADVPHLQLAGIFTNAPEALLFLQKHDVNVIFLDIHLPTISGIEFIKSLTHPPAIILTTAFSDYALEGFNLNVVDYLLKPFSFQRFLQAVGKAEVWVQSEQKPREEEIFIKSGYDYLQISIAEITFIKSDSDYTELVTTSNRYLATEPLKHWVERFKDLPFVQVHKSYIVHIPHISRVSGGTIYLHTGKSIPIGRAYKDRFFSLYLE